MRKLILCLFLICLPFFQIDAAADGYCPSRKGGKCPSARNSTHKRSDYSESQRAAFMKQARAICVKKYGAGSSVYRIDYQKWRVICNETGY
jgi:hypothetical protein